MKPIDFGREMFFKREKKGGGEGKRKGEPSGDVAAAAQHMNKNKLVKEDKVSTYTQTDG